MTQYHTPDGVFRETSSVNLREPGIPLQEMPRLNTENIVLTLNDNAFSPSGAGVGTCQPAVS